MEAQEFHPEAIMGSSVGGKRKKGGPGSRIISAEDQEAFPAAVRALLGGKLGMAEKCVKNEVVFDRTNHNCGHITLRVRTSIACGADAMRGCGDDAIEVSAFYQRDIEGQMLRKGVYKGTKILRTGSLEKVLGRLEERVRDAYAVSNRFAKEQQCKHPDCVAMRITRAQTKAAASTSGSGK